MRTARFLVGISLVAVGGCAALTTQEGDGLARSLAERVAIGIADDTAAEEPLDADYLALSAITDPRLPPDKDVSYRVETIGWEGNSGDDDGAQVKLRIAVDVAARGAESYGGRYRTAGSVTRCWTLTVHAVPDWHDDAWNLDEFSCPDGASAATPEPTPLLTMPSDAAERLRVVVSSVDPGASTGEIEAAVRREFSDPGYDVAVVRSGEELGVVLIVQREHNCAIAVADAQGDVSAYSEHYVPGEGGCGPDFSLPD